MTIRTAVAFAILLCIAIQMGAGDRSVAPWEWTRADRLERRYDPALAAERRRTSTHCRSGCGDSVVVDGSVHPELLLPAELMDTLAGMYAMQDTARRDAVRTLWLRRAPGLERSRFWDDLHAAGRPFFEASAELHQLNRRLDEVSGSEREQLEARRDQVFDTLCSRREAALAAARALFGQKTFDRFLYQAIAPGVFISESGTGVSAATAPEEVCP
ncbi:MAG TPA: hypothetical protein VF266_25320 [Thermoanaerobaculia bacterium]